METGITNYDSAFPGSASTSDGLTKREYFACKMLAAIVANEGAAGKWPDGADGPAKESIRQQDARRACLYAGALIEALNKEPDAGQT